MAMICSIAIIGSRNLKRQNTVFHQFCNNASPEMIDILIEYQNPGHIDNTLLVYFRVSVLFIALCLIVGELVIYVKLIFDMWKHDNISLLRNIITPAIRKERKMKNIITLEGQFALFMFKLFSCTFFILSVVFNFRNAPSLMPFCWITSTTLISVSELLASHDLREYLYHKLFE